MGRQKAGKRPNTRGMTEAAALCIQTLKAKRQDISMLFLLKNFDWLGSFGAGRELVEWIRYGLKLRFSAICSPEFQAEVAREYELGGSGLHPVAPERFVFAVTKDEVKRLCSEAQWPRPFFPVMLQTRPASSGTFVKRADWKNKARDPTYRPGVFIIYSCWSDALHALVDIAKRKEFHGFPADVVYENQLVDLGPKHHVYPCRVILDCDAKLSEFNDEYTLAELRESIDRVPLWYVQQLLKLGAIKRTDRVWVTQKNKDRETKASSHFIFSIYGISVADTRELFERIFVTAREEAEGKKKKTAAAATAEEEEAEAPTKKKRKKQRSALPEPWRVTDPAPFHGRFQFSTLLFYAKHKGETQMPVVTRRIAFVDGAIEQEIPVALGRQLEGHANPDALALLHACGYTSFIPDFVTFAPGFMVERTAAGKVRTTTVSFRKAAA